MSLRRWLRDRLAGYRWTSGHLRRVGLHNSEHFGQIEPWPDPDNLKARLLIAEGRLRHAQYEIQFIRSQLAELESNVD
jgi:hypothetical protein